MPYDEDQIEALPTLLKFAAVSYSNDSSLVDLLNAARGEIERLREELAQAETILELNHDAIEDSRIMGGE